MRSEHLRLGGRDAMGDLMRLVWEICMRDFVWEKLVGDLGGRFVWEK